MIQPRLAAPLGGLLLSCSIATAQTDSLANNWPDLVHKVVAGDTLEALALRYTGQRANWRSLQQANHVVDPRRLMPGQTLRVPAALRLPAPALVRVLYTHGQAWARLPAGDPTVPLTQDMTLPEGTRIEVGDNAYVRLAFPDGSVAALPQGTRVQLGHVRRQPLAGIQQTELRIETGRADAQVQPLRRAGSRFQIRTPLAVASVRGTRFGVQVQPDASVTSEVLEGHVDVADARPGTTPSQRSAASLSAGQGTQATSAAGVAAARPLPSAPDLAALPGTLTDADAVVVPLPAATSAQAYRVRVALDMTMDAVVGNVVAAASAGVAVLPALPDGTYAIGLRAIDEAGLHSAETVRALRIKAHPLPPLFQSPGPQARVHGSEVTLRCIAPRGAARVLLQVAPTPTFESPVVDMQDMAACSQTVALPPGTYYWRLATVEARPGEPVDTGPYSRPQRFELVALPPAPAELNLAPSASGLRVHWAALPGLRYRVQVAADAAFAAPLLYDQVLDSGDVHIDGLAPGHYLLRIQAIGPDGVAGPFGPAWQAQAGPSWVSPSGQPLLSGDRPVLQAPAR